MPASVASMIASAANAGGTKMIDTLAWVSLTASTTVLKTGLSIWSTPSLARRYPANDLGTVIDHLRGVKSPFRSRKALYDDPGLFID